MKRILFVDDDARVLSGLRRQMRAHRAEWEMNFAPGGPEALLELASGAFDVVVSDMCMPVVDGAQVLAHVANDQPRAARLVLSGNASEARMRLATSCAHRYLHKPCPADVLELEITQALSMRALLDELSDDRCEQIWARPPGFMDECEAVLEALNLEPASVTDDVITMLRDDDELRQRVAQAASGLHPQTLRGDSRIQQVSSVLGARGVLGAIMAVRFLDNFSGGSPEAWHGALRLAVRAGQIARDENLTSDAISDALVAGLLFHLVEGEGDERRLDALSYLLPTWGFDEGVVTALTIAPRRSEAEAAKVDAGTALIAARFAAGDPSQDSLATHLRAAGWLERVERSGPLA
ncbi:MAG: two-component system response regulator [Planctomycetota bacterium]|nr:MAG: two-component system response regulator [Planctomycetota bacterium]